MFSLDPVLESRYVVRKTRGSVAVHFISTVAMLLDFLLKFLFAEHISSVSLCHLASLATIIVPGEMFSQPIAGRFVFDFNIRGAFKKAQLLKLAITLRTIGCNGSVRGMSPL